MRPKQWIGLVIVALAAVGTFVVPGLDRGAEPSGPSLGCDGARDDPAERPTLCLLNAERRRHDLRPLRRDRALDRAAAAHARDMKAGAYFAHEGRDGSSPDQRIRRAGYDGRMTGENLAQGEREAGAPSSIVDGWMHSPGHRANVLRRRFDEIGIAIARDGDLAIYVTTFGATR